MKSIKTIVALHLAATAALVGGFIYLMCNNSYDD